MPNSVIQPSFSGGELSPSLYGRVDLAKYHSGVALARNFYVDYRGGLSSRPGSAFVGQCKDSSTISRLIPFTYSTIQTYALLFGNYTMRVIKNGAYVTEPTTAITGITQASPGVVTDTAHGYSTGDLLYLAGIGGMTQLNGRFATVVVIGANSYSLLDMYGVPIATSSYAAYTAGGTAARVFTLVTPYAAADLALLKYSQSADTMTLTHISYPEQQLTRSQHWVWTIVPTSFLPTSKSPTNVAATPRYTGPPYTLDTTYNYVITAVGANNISESLPSTFGSVLGSALSTTAGARNTVTWNGNPGDTLYNIYRTPENPGGAPAIGALYGYIGSATPATANSFVDNNIQPDFTHTPPMANNPFAVGAIGSVTVTAGGTGYTAAPTVTITDPTGTGCTLQAQLLGTSVTSVTVLTAGTGYTSPTVSISGSGTGATATAAIAPPNYPACSTYFQQRQVRGGMAQQPQSLVFSKTGDFKNMGYATPSQPSDELQVTLASVTVNPIKHLVSLTSLIVLTGSGAWRVDGGSQSDTVTPDKINAVPQAYNGCSDVPPIVVNTDILYVQAKGSMVRDLTYNFYVNVYTGTDLSSLSNHLFFGHQILEWCWAEEPFKVIWAVRDDGILLSLTFLKEQEIYGWCRHDTNGLYKSICSISEGPENAVYMVVERLVNGQYLQYVERFASRSLSSDPALGIPADLTKAWCVDAGLQYTPVNPAATLTPATLTGPTIISSAPVIAGGTGYVAPVASISDPTGVGATLSVTVVGGVITAVTVTAAGTGYTNPTVTITDSAGTGAVVVAVVQSPITFNASAAVLAGTVGQVLRTNGGIGIVTSASATQVVANMTQALTNTWPSAAGTWSLTPQVSTLTGLDHLVGQSVSILADGNVQPTQVVALQPNGGIGVALAVPASAVTVGLGFVAQVKSLYLDVQEQGGTIQGKRKKINAVTVRVQDTRGLKVGPTFTALHEMKERTTQAMGQAIPLLTQDERVLIEPSYNVGGQLCIQQDQPLPATILAVIPEITIGDT